MTKLTYKTSHRLAHERPVILPMIDGGMVWPIAPEHWTEDVQRAISHAYAMGFYDAKASAIRHLDQVEHGIISRGRLATTWEQADE